MKKVILTMVLFAAQFSNASDCTEAVKDQGGIAQVQIQACRYIRTATQLECVKVAKDLSGVSVAQIQACADITKDYQLNCVKGSEDLFGQLPASTILSCVQ